jgi:hypothetical protein
LQLPDLNNQKMDAKILLGCILQKFIDVKVSQYKQYNSFAYISHSNSSLTVGREKGIETQIYFKKIIIGIEGYQSDISKYDKGPTALRSLNLTHITSPIHSLLHLLPWEYYK